MSLSLDRCEDETAWNDFVANSPHGSVFCTTPFLKALREPFDLYFVREQGRPLLAIPVNESAPVFIPYGHYTTFRFAVFQGPMFSPEVEQLAAHSRAPRALKLMDFALTELAARHTRLPFVLSPWLTDIRSFQWFNYHQPAGGRFDVHLRYTGLIDLQSRGGVLSRRGIRRSRRQDAERAARQGVLCESSADLDILDWLDDLVYERQSLKRDLTDRAARRVIAESALSQGYGKLLLGRSSSGEVASAYLCLFDRRCAYHLFAGNHPDLRQTGISSFLLLHALDLFEAEGQRWFDCVGMNSPARGDFKSSFNALPTPHYLVDWRKPQG